MTPDYEADKIMSIKMHTKYPLLVFETLLSIENTYVIIRSILFFLEQHHIIILILVYLKKCL